MILIASFRILILVLASFPLFASAVNQTEVITSIFHGGTPYMVVSKVGKKAEKEGSDYDPGLYHKEKGHWNLAFPGQVLLDDRKGPFVHQLAISKFDDRFTSLTVINGDLYIVTSLSKKEAPDSFIKLGSSSEPLVELDTRQERFLQPIKNTKSISIYALDQLDKNGSQPVVISIKFDQQTPIGRALTFSFGIKPSPHTDKVELVNKPVVIDHKFHDVKDLQALVSTKDSSLFIYSETLMDSFLNVDISSFGRHEDLIRKKYMEPLRKLHRDHQQIANLSQRLSYNFTSQSVHDHTNLNLESRILDVLVSEEAQIRTGRSDVSISFGSHKQTITGMIDRFDGQFDRYKAWTSSNNRGHALVIINGQIHFIHHPSSVHLPLVYNLGKLCEIFDCEDSDKIATIESVKDLNVVSYEKRYEDRSEIAILLSVRNEDLKLQSTQLIALRNYNDQIIVNRGIFPLVNHFLTVDSMTERVKEISNSLILFDLLTPAQKSNAAYRQAYDTSLPHLSLIETVDKATMIYKYNRPSEVIDIKEGISYAKFTAVPNIPNPTGLYFSTNKDADITGNENSRILGELLIKPSRIDQDNPPAYLAHYDVRNFHYSSLKLDEDDYVAPMSGDNRQFYVFAIDASYSGGKDGFNLIFATNYSLPNNRFIYRVLPLSGGGMQKFESLKDINFVRGRQNHDDFLAVVVSFKSDLDQERTIYIPFNLKTFDKTNPNPVTLSPQFVSSKELGDRLGFDEQGVPYFVMTPEVPQDSVNFVLHSMTDHRLVHPNQNFGPKKINVKIGARLTSDLTYIVPLKDSWRVGPHEIEKSVKPTRVREVEEFESFVDLKAKLNRLAMTDVPPERLMLVVPQSLRGLVWDFVLGLYMQADANKHNQPFHRSNRNLILNILDSNKGTQEQFFENIKAMSLSKDSGERSVLIGRMDEISKMKFPESENGNPFHITDVVANNGSDLAEISGVEEARYPHALYLLSAQGALPLEDYRRSAPSPLFSSLIVVTPEELENLDSEATSEVDAGLMQAFSVSEIRNPDQESMATSLIRIFDAPEVKSLDYKFSGQAIRPRSVIAEDEHLEIVIDYAISRFNALVEQKKQNLFESFMRFRANFASAILTDRQARQTKMIDKLFVERVLNQVFDIPLNLDTLPPDDPIRILSKKDAVSRLQEAGYSGPFDLKTRVIRTILTQTQSDAGKPIPSSTILFGETGAGKTFLFTSLVKMLGLQLYDVNGSATENANASAIIINVGKIIEDNSKDSDPSTMSVGKAIHHLNTFLSLHNGYRGWILIDDAHAASDKVRGEIISWLRALFESSGGMYQTIKGQKRPIRNLNIFMTLNPTADQEQVGRYSKDKAKPTSDEILIATLSGANFKVEPSFLKRWNTIINLNYMPVGAKGPELIKSIAESSKNLLSARNKIAFVDPKVVRRLVHDNEKVDARSFLSASTSALMEMASHEAPGNVLLLVPTLTGRLHGGLSYSGTEQTAAERIGSWVNSYTRALSLDKGLEGNLALMELLINAYRIPLYEFLIGSIQEDLRFADDLSNQKVFLAPALAAISDHLTERPELPLNELHLMASAFGLTTSAQREMFSEAIDTLSSSQLRTPFFPTNFGKTAGNESWKELFDSNHSHQSELTRQAVIIESISTNRTLAYGHLQKLLKVSNLNAFPDPVQYLMSLTPSDIQAIKSSGKALANELWAFYPKMFSDALVETLNSDDKDPLTIYGATRLFLYSIDKAITQLPWVEVNRFFLQCLDLITQDQVLSQKPGVQALVFTDRYRLLKPTITDLAFQMISNSPILDTISAKTRENMRKTFTTDCETLLIPPSEI